MARKLRLVNESCLHLPKCFQDIDNSHQIFLWMAGFYVLSQWEENMEKSRLNFRECLPYFENILGQSLIKILPYGNQ